MLLFIIRCCLLLHVYYYMLLFIVTCCCLLLHVYCCLGRETEWRLEWLSRELMPGATMILWVNYQLSALVSSGCLWQRKAAAVTQWGPLLFEIKKPLGLLPLCDTIKSNTAVIQICNLSGWLHFHVALALIVPSSHEFEPVFRLSFELTWGFYLWGHLRSDIRDGRL